MVLGDYLLWHAKKMVAIVTATILDPCYLFHIEHLFTEVFTNILGELPDFRVISKGEGDRKFHSGHFRKSLSVSLAYAFELG